MDSKILNLLWPDGLFSGISFNSSEDVTKTFVSITLLLFIVGILILCYYIFKYIRDNLNLYSKVKSLSLSDLSKGISPIADPTFIEFYNDIIWRNNKPYTTTPIDETFNTHKLAWYISNSRLIPSFVTLLTGLGVLGTFLGLTVGLSDLTFKGTSDEIIDQIRNMTACASTAFVTSVWGVSTGMALNFFRILGLFSVTIIVKKIKVVINDLFPLNSPVDDFMVDVKNDISSGRDILAGLAEEIGHKMQDNSQFLITSFTEQVKESNNILCDKIESQITDNARLFNETMGHLDILTDKLSTNICNGMQQSISNTMQPAVSELVNASKELNTKNMDSSTDALETLLEKFVEEISKAGNEQRIKMENATGNLKAILEENALQTKQFFETVNNQQKIQTEGLQKQTEQMIKSVETTLNSVLEQLSSEIGESGTLQRENFATVTSELQRTINENAEQSARILDAFKEQQKQHAELMQSQNSKIVEDINSFMNNQIANVSQMEELLKEHSKSSGNVVDNVRSIQQAFKANIDSLEIVSSDFIDLSKELKESCASMQKMGDTINTTLRDVSSSIANSLTSSNNLLKGNKAIQDSFISATDKLDDVKNNLEKTSDTFLDAAKMNNAHYLELAKSYQNVQDKLTSSLTLIQDQISNIMTQYNIQVEDLFGKYVGLVSEQTSSRLRSWDNETKNFCTSMSAVVRVIGDLVDNFESKKNK